jgi:hypothetical protein
VDGLVQNTVQTAGDTNELVRNLRTAMMGKATSKPVAMPLPKLPEVPAHLRIDAAIAPSPASPQPAVTMVLPEVAAPAHKPVQTDLSALRSVKKVGMGKFMAAFAAITLLGLVGIWNGNRAYGPEMYGHTGMVPAAEASSKNLNYAVFDLNLNIRQLREEQIKRMPKAHDVVLLGASHWQEGDRETLAPGVDFFNSHIHRDYWEDLLGMVNLYVKYDRLPKKMIISIRDNQFKPVELRRDFLWEPGIGSYHEMTQRLGIKAQPFYKTLPYDRMRALVSLPMLFENATRWYNATERPHETTERQFETLDTLLPDGSIVWSRQRMKFFDQERSLRESMAFVEFRRNDPPVVDPKGVAAFEETLKFLKEKGVEVSFVKPPFNPIYFDAVQQGTYAEGLKNIEKLIEDLASRHGLKVYGSYNPHDIGCEASVYIDAEHANNSCLAKVLAPFVADHLGKDKSS